MAEETTDEEIRPTLMNPQYRRVMMATGVVIVLLTLTSWIGSIRTNRARVDTLRSATSALAAALQQDILDANSQRTVAGRERLSPLITDIAKAGGYRVVTLTDGKGKVLVSTDKNLEGESIKELPDSGTEIEKTRSGLRAIAPIKLGGNVIGYLQVETEH